MIRARGLSYIVGAILIVISVYTLLSLSSDPDSQSVKIPGSTYTHEDHTQPGSAKEGSSDPYDKPYNQRPYEDEYKQYTTTTPYHIPKPAAQSTSKPPSQHTSHPSQPHAIKQVDDLIEEADKQFEETLSTETHSLEDAAAAYRKRRGRHPPPGFDLWYHYAAENNAIMVEAFWDQIYHDLNPFWAIEPAMIRTQARKLGMGAELKGGIVVKTADWFWHNIWGRMINETAKHLPDMFIAMNPMDESRLLVKWEDINDFMMKANAEKALTAPKDVIRNIKGWTFEGNDPDIEAPNENWNGFNPYNYARRACAPDSPARQVAGVLTPQEVLAFRDMTNPKVDVSQYFDDGYVTNYTEASDFCSDATIGGLHGALMLPLTCQNSDVLMPMFGGSKFHVNNEILLPAPMYWNGEDRFGGDEINPDPVPWRQKEDRTLWRGTATGGRNKPFMWYMFHRHRFVAMTNGTRYAHADKTGHDLIFNELLQETAIKSLNPQIQSHLGDWLSLSHDTGFTDLVCDENEKGGSCWYTDDEFERVPKLDFLDQFANKYLPDIDGNSFSGRYRAFILSNSVPIKATIYREWHDSRLLAWKHFVPMNNRFSDYYRIMQYFLGDESRGIAGRDDHAKKIATEGSEWGAKVLRKVDMQIYVFRLLLEYGRLTDDKRLQIGWVDDLIGAAGNNYMPGAVIEDHEEPGA